MFLDTRTEKHSEAGKPVLRFERYTAAHNTLAITSNDTVGRDDVSFGNLIPEIPSEFTHYLLYLASAISMGSGLSASM